MDGPRPNACFSRILAVLTEVFGRDIRANHPRMSAGCPSQKLPLWADFSFLTTEGGGQSTEVWRVGNCFLWGFPCEISALPSFLLPSLAFYVLKRRLVAALTTHPVLLEEPKRVPKQPGGTKFNANFRNRELFRQRKLPKSLISLVSRDVSNFLAPTRSRGRPLPHWNEYPDQKVWVWVRFSCLTLGGPRRPSKRVKKRISGGLCS